MFYSLMGEVCAGEEKSAVFWALTWPHWVSDAFIFAGPSAQADTSQLPPTPTPTPTLHQRQCQHFYWGVIIREYSLCGKADVILYNTEKMQLSKLKNEMGEDLRLWRRVKPEPPAPAPLLVISLSTCSDTSISDRSCPQPFQCISSSFS